MNMSITNCSFIFIVELAKATTIMFGFHFLKLIKYHYTTRNLAIRDGLSMTD
jgi:hypothetical protein